jgi:hypothetical protein
MSPRDGTLKAPLFSEQVALLTGLDEPAANELKHYLEAAQDGSRPPPAKLLVRAAWIAAAATLLGLSLAAFVPDAHTLGLIVAPLGMGAFAWLGRMALQSQEKEAALLIQKLSHAVAKRQRTKTEPTGPIKIETDKNG